MVEVIWKSRGSILRKSRRNRKSAKNIDKGYLVSAIPNRNNNNNRSRAAIFSVNVAH